MNNRTFTLACTLIPVLLNRHETNVSDEKTIEEAFCLAEKFEDRISESEILNQSTNNEDNEKLRKIVSIIKGRGDSVTKCAKINDLISFK
jgi:uncharacterized protein YaaR (DUF327 family)